MIKILYLSNYAFNLEQCLCFNLSQFLLLFISYEKLAEIKLIISSSGAHRTYTASGMHMHLPQVCGLPGLRHRERPFSLPHSGGSSHRSRQSASPSHRRARGTHRPSGHRRPSHGGSRAGGRG